MLGIDKKTINILPTSLFVLSAIIWRTPYYNIGLYVCIPIIIGYCFYKYYPSILTSKYWVPYLLLIFWMFVSSISNYNVDASLKIMIPITSTFLLCFSVYSLAQHGENSNMLSLGFICLFIAIFYATITSDVFTTSFDYANEAEREANTEMNANQYAYFSLFAIMSVRLILGKKSIKRPTLRILLYFLMAILSFYIALITASRQVMLLELPLIAFFIYNDFLRSASINKRIIMMGVTVLFFVFLLPEAIEQYDNSYLAVRSSENLQEDTRSFLLLFGWEQGLDNPFFGLGLGAVTHFSHCTYTHLMARCGIPALVLYVYIICLSIFEQIKKYNRTRDPYFILYLLFAIIFAFANFFYSYIDQPYMMTVLFLIVGESDKVYRQLAKV